MRFRISTLLLLTAFLCSGGRPCCAEEVAPAVAERETLKKGLIQSLTYQFKEAGKEMEYAVYLPTSYDAKRKFPLVVALHGLFSNPRQILSYPGFIGRAEKHGYVLVAPMGYNNRGWYGSRGSRRRGADGKPSVAELSELDVMNVLAIARKRFSIDDRRIYLLGHSMGGGGSFHLAMKHPKIWAAIAPISPATPSNIHDLKHAKHIPAIVVQGDRDRLVPVAGVRRWVEKMKELEMKHRYIEVKGGDHVLVAFRYFDEIFEFFNEHSQAKPTTGKN